MRPTWFLLSRNAQSEHKVPLKPRPIAEEKVLRANIKKDKEGCMPQMTLLLACLKTDASGRFCKNELEDLRSCYNKYQKKLEYEKAERKRGIPAPNAKILTQDQTKYLLRKYPLV